jgi:hypothetical protein
MPKCRKMDSSRKHFIITKIEIIEEFGTLYDEEFHNTYRPFSIDTSATLRICNAVVVETREI